MKITPYVFEAYLMCQTKCWLLATNEPPVAISYPTWVKAQNDAYCTTQIERLIAESPNSEVARSPAVENIKAEKWRLAIDLFAHKRNLESSIQAVERIPSAGRGQSAKFIPIRYVFTNKISRDEKLLLAFDASVLSEVLGHKVGIGKIIHGDDRVTLKVKASALAGEVLKITGKIATLLSQPSPPDLVLNPHCAECQFQTPCRQMAIDKDDLSLLSGMTEKERKSFNSKGIFTVTQLSYTFRPRRRPKRLAAKSEKYHHSLKALAIRQHKVHFVGSHELAINGVPVYLDVEGLPDRESYYLIGLRVKTANGIVQHSLWADSAAEERRIWHEFLEILSGIDSPILFLRRMRERYGGPPVGSLVEKVLASSLNILSYIYARIYFPTYANGLKDRAKFLGFEWTATNASGAQAVVWRSEWENSRETQKKHSLINYNAEDCEALQLVTEFVSRPLALSAGHAEQEVTDIVNVESLPLPSRLNNLETSSFNFQNLKQ